MVQLSRRVFVGAIAIVLTVRLAGAASLVARALWPSAGRSLFAAITAAPESMTARRRQALGQFEPALAAILAQVPEQGVIAVRFKPNPLYQEFLRGVMQLAYPRRFIAAAGCGDEPDGPPDHLLEVLDGPSVDPPAGARLLASGRRFRLFALAPVTVAPPAPPTPSPNAAGR